jgi:hypothetical protein
MIVSPYHSIHRSSDHVLMEEVGVGGDSGFLIAGELWLGWQHGRWVTRSLDIREDILSETSLAVASSGISGFV